MQDTIQKQLAEFCDLVRFSRQTKINTTLSSLHKSKTLSIEMISNQVSFVYDELIQLNIL